MSETIPLVLDTLRDAKQIQLRAITEFEASLDPAERDAMEESAKAIKPVLTTCKENVGKLQKIFEEVVPGSESTRTQRYWKALQTLKPGKSRRAEDLMKEVLEKLQLLHVNRFFKDGITSQKLDEALDDITKVPSSLPDENSH